jgi:hypothetical protein
MKRFDVTYENLFNWLESDIKKDCYNIYETVRFKVVIDRWCSPKDDDSIYQLTINDKIKDKLCLKAQFVKYENNDDKPLGMLCIKEPSCNLNISFFKEDTVPIIILKNTNYDAFLNIILYDIIYTEEIICTSKDNSLLPKEVIEYRNRINSDIVKGGIK